jgi:hypothetical protein
MENPNSFAFIAKDFDVVLSTVDGVAVGEVHLDGGSISSYSTESFVTTASLSFHGEAVTTLQADITSRIGASFLGIFTKTIPLELTIIAPLEHFIHDIQAPDIHLSADLTDLSQEGVALSTSIEVSNTNGFDMYLQDVLVSITDDEGESVGSLEIPDTLVQGNDETTIEITGFIDLAALNAHVLSMSLSGSAGLSIAGMNKSVSLDTSATIHLPDLNALLSETLPTDLEMRGDYRLTLSGVRINVTIEVINPNNIDIQTEDLTVSVYRVDNDEETFIAQVNLGGGIALAGDSYLAQGDVVLPYRSFLRAPGHFGLPDWMCVRVYANMSVPGIDTALWVGICEYQDMNVFR